MKPDDIAAIALERHVALNPADDSPRYWVTGPAGTVQYDLLGNHLFTRDTTGDIEAFTTRWANEVRDLVRAGYDDEVFDLLGFHYSRELEASRR